MQGELLYINSLERLFLGGVPKDFDAKGVPVSRFAASLFNVPCHSAKKEPTIAILMRFVITPKDPTTAHVNQDMKGTEIIAQVMFFVI